MEWRKEKGEYQRRGKAPGERQGKKEKVKKEKEKTRGWDREGQIRNVRKERGKRVRKEGMGMEILRKGREGRCNKKCEEEDMHESYK